MIACFRPARMTRQIAYQVVGLLIATLFVSPARAGSYGLQAYGFSNAVSPGFVTDQSFLQNGALDVCTPSLTGACGLVHGGTAPNAASVFSEASVPGAALTTNVDGSALGVARIQLLGNAAGLVSPVDAILHLTYGWNISTANNGGVILQYGLSGGYTNVNGGVSVSQSSPNPGSAALDLTFHLAPADNFTVNFDLKLQATSADSLNSGASFSHAWANYWLELPTGGALASNSPFVPLSAPATQDVPEPLSVLIFAVGAMVLAAARFGVFGVCRRFEISFAMSGLSPVSRGTRLT